MPTITRRIALGSLFVAGGAVAAGSAGLAFAEEPGRSNTYVFVHGTNASSAFWTPYARELQFRGHRCIAVDLPFHGAKAYIPESYQPQDLEALATEASPLGEVGLDDFAAHVEKAVRRAAKDGPVVLVGHSMGGASLSRVGSAVPELVAHLCYMAAYCCSPALPTIVDCMTAPESESAIIPADIAVGDPEALGVNRYNFLGATAKQLRTLKEMAWGGNSDASFRAGLLSMQPDESALVPTQRAVGDPETWGGIRRTYLRFGADRLITPELQDRMIAEADELTPDNRFRVHDFDAPHFGPEDVGAVVDVLTDLE